MAKKKEKITIAVLCGGPSPERGISLNSARSVSDHLFGDDIDIVPIYFDFSLKAFALSRGQLYSNTPSDFDFKLKQTGKALSNAALLKLLRSVDLVFPAMHGRFGEDGQIQKFLEKHDIPFVGTGSEECARCFDKSVANAFIAANGFYAIPSLAIKKSEKNLKSAIGSFFKQHKLERAVIKPAVGGSSIGVYSVTSAKEAEARAKELFATGLYAKLVLEPFCKGVEFTSIILENRFGLPVCLLPVEIEADYFKNQIFDYRKKYLPTRQVNYHCPPRFRDQDLERITYQAEALFKMLGMRDVARFDGWLLEDGNIAFSDFNPISGMEQNSFLFLQSARMGMSHRDVLRFIVARTCVRYGIPWTGEPKAVIAEEKKKKVSVILGGSSAERQVSVMSGTNAWLKLSQSKRYKPELFLLDTKSNVWSLPYAYALNHTVEEITENCEQSKHTEVRLKTLRDKIVPRLFPFPWQISLPTQMPIKMTLNDFLSRNDYVLNGLHGGIGENGVLQKMMVERGVRFNGPGPEASRLSTDKAETAEVVKRAAIPGVFVPEKLVVSTTRLAQLEEQDFQELWNEMRSKLPGRSFIVKPLDDGCSAGVARLFGVEDIRNYTKWLLKKEQRIPENTLHNQSTPIEMPSNLPAYVIFEQFIETDKVAVINGKLQWKRISDWIEVTIGVVGPQDEMRALSPSLTVASGNVLTVEEKFQGGTGINITPPPKEFVPEKIVKRFKEKIEAIAKVVGLSNYSRMDAFLNIKTGDVCLIEVNTLPALTPSTVLFHQALAEPKPMYPREFLEYLIDTSIKG